MMFVLVSEAMLPMMTGDECRNMGRSAYCWMVAMLDSEWVVCQRGDDCPRGGKFHLQCADLAQIPETWYCSNSCKIGNHGSDDHVQQYSLAVTWRGLLLMVGRDAERENDGEMMMTLWTLNVPEFWERNHYKYLILGHRLQASINGWMPRRIREELTWNSTSNVQGGSGNSIALDLLNEFLNNEFKSNLNHLYGQYSDTSIERCSKMAGSLGKEIENTVQCDIINKYSQTAKSTRANYKSDVGKFVKMYGPKYLFDYIPGRKHKSFPKFVHHSAVRKLDKFRERLKKYSRVLDNERNLMI